MERAEALRLPILLTFKGSSKVSGAFEEERGISNKAGSGFVSGIIPSDKNPDWAIAIRSQGPRMSSTQLFKDRNFLAVIGDEVPSQFRLC
jgi:hypothetical protein